MTTIVTTEEQGVTIVTDIEAGTLIRFPEKQMSLLEFDKVVKAVERHREIDNAFFDGPKKTASAPGLSVSLDSLIKFATAIPAGPQLSFTVDRFFTGHKTREQVNEYIQSLNINHCGSTTAVGGPYYRLLTKDEFIKWGLNIDEFVWPDDGLIWLADGELEFNNSYKFKTYITPVAKDLHILTN